MSTILFYGFFCSSASQFVDAQCSDRRVVENSVDTQHPPKQMSPKSLGQPAEYLGTAANVAIVA